MVINSTLTNQRLEAISIIYLRIYLFVSFTMLSVEKKSFTIDEATKRVEQDYGYISI